MHLLKNTRYALRVLMLVILAVIGLSVKQSAVNSNTVTQTHLPDEFSEADVKAGQLLARQYCQSCHQLPDPSLLNKSVWRNSVLPAMGRYYGINPGRLPRRGEAAEEPTIDRVKWMQINAYFITKSPEHLPDANITEPIRQLPQFEVMPAPAEWYSTRAFASYAKIDTSVAPHRIIVNNGLTNKLAILNNKLQTLDTSKQVLTLVNLLFQSNKIFATSIGYNLQPNDFKEGNISEVTIGPNGAYAVKGKPLFDRLNRPLSVNLTDLNQDGKPDYLISQFGKDNGSLSWFEKTGSVTKEHVLRAKPGCLKTIIDRSNKFKRPDVWALFAQGDEGIFLYENQGKGIFKEKRILSFPPSYGSINFDLVDFNGDGFKDIVYVCGDNADYSQILKPYHGVYIYLNDGKNNFTQKFFYPIHGCSKAIVKDFDGDGDLDIATISEYPGGKTLWEAFIYLENKGDFNFQPYALPADVKFTRGLTMDVGDIDGDGKPDLLLGAGFAAEDIDGTDKQPLFIVLKNTGKSGEYK